MKTLPSSDGRNSVTSDSSERSVTSPKTSDDVSTRTSEAASSRSSEAAADALDNLYKSFNILDFVANDTENSDDIDSHSSGCYITLYSESSNTQESFNEDSNFDLSQTFPLYHSLEGNGVTSELMRTELSEPYSPYYSSEGNGVNPLPLGHSYIHPSYHSIHEDGDNSLDMEMVSPHLVAPMINHCDISSNNVELGNFTSEFDEHLLDPEVINPRNCDNLNFAQGPQNEMCKSETTQAMCDMNQDPLLPLEDPMVDLDLDYPMISLPDDDYMSDSCANSTLVDSDSSTDMSFVKDLPSDLINKINDAAVVCSKVETRLNSFNMVSRSDVDKIRNDIVNGWEADLPLLGIDIVDTKVEEKVEPIFEQRIYHKDKIEEKPQISSNESLKNVSKPTVQPKVAGRKRIDMKARRYIVDSDDDEIDIETVEKEDNPLIKSNDANRLLQDNSRTKRDSQSQDKSRTKHSSKSKNSKAKRSSKNVSPPQNNSRTKHSSLSLSPAQDISKTKHKSTSLSNLRDKIRNGHLKKSTSPPQDNSRSKHSSKYVSPPRDDSRTKHSSKSDNSRTKQSSPSLSPVQDMSKNKHKSTSLSNPRDDSRTRHLSKSTSPQDNSRSKHVSKYVSLPQDDLRTKHSSTSVSPTQDNSKSKHLSKYVSLPQDNLRTKHSSTSVSPPQDNSKSKHLSKYVSPPQDNLRTKHSSTSVSPTQDNSKSRHSSKLAPPQDNSRTKHSSNSRSAPQDKSRIQGQEQRSTMQKPSMDVEKVVSKIKEGSEKPRTVKLLDDDSFLSQLFSNSHKKRNGVRKPKPVPIRQGGNLNPGSRTPALSSSSSSVSQASAVPPKPVVPPKPAVPPTPAVPKTVVLPTAVVRKINGSFKKPNINNTVSSIKLDHSYFKSVSPKEQTTAKGQKVLSLEEYKNLYSSKKTTDETEPPKENWMEKMLAPPPVPEGLIRIESYDIGIDACLVENQTLDNLSSLEQVKKNSNGKIDENSLMNCYKEVITNKTEAPVTEFTFLHEDHKIKYVKTDRQLPQMSDAAVQTNLSLVPKKNEASGTKRSRSPSTSSISSDSSFDSDSSDDSSYSRRKRMRTNTNKFRSSSVYSSSASSVVIYNPNIEFSHTFKSMEEHEEFKRDALNRRILFLGGIPDDVDEKYLVQTFERYGEIKLIKIYHRMEGGKGSDSVPQSRDFAFITYKQSSGVVDAMNSYRRDYPYGPQFQMSYGGRREFCQERYKDLDYQPRYYSSSEVNATREESSGATGASDSFDSLLEEYKQRRGLVAPRK